MIDREVLRCAFCRLNQFATRSRNCRKCRQPYDPPEVEVIPEVAPIAAIKEVGPRHASRSQIDMAFAVKLLRQAQGVSQKELAKTLGLQRTHVSKIENRRCLPTLAILSRIAEAFQIPQEGLIQIACI